MILLQHPPVFRAAFVIGMACLLGTAVSPGAESVASPAALESLKYQFGTAAPANGRASVSPDLAYSAEHGYGFEPESAGRSRYFSVALPEGNYKVTVMLGDAKDATDTTVKAELRRLMLLNVATKPGEFVTKSFIVNVRRPAIVVDGKTTANVSLKKPRENSGESGQEAWAWDDKLTLEFSGAHPSVQSLDVEKADVPTVYLMGDSTMCDQYAEPWTSWGQMLTYYLKPDIAVSNQAESGETLADSLGRKRFDKIWSTIKKGDYLFIQFGHNDMKSTAPGALETYKANLKKVIGQAKTLGATPVIVSSMERKNGITSSTLMGYPEAAIEVAKAENVPWIDLHTTSQTLYAAIGADLNKAFVDGTHHTRYGSTEIVKCIVLGIQNDKLDLAAHIVDGFTFDPAHPDTPAQINIPASAVIDPTAPAGN